jgi:hypothetical protein
MLEASLLVDGRRRHVGEVARRGKRAGAARLCVYSRRSFLF